MGDAGSRETESSAPSDSALQFDAEAGITAQLDARADEVLDVQLADRAVDLGATVDAVIADTLLAIDVVDITLPVDVTLDAAATDILLADGPGNTGPESSTADVPDLDDGLCPLAAPVRCAGVCVGDTSSNPARCGDDCVACVAPAGGVATCTSGTCSFECAPGHLTVGAACVDAPPPRPVHPLSNSRVSVRAPMLRWALPADVSTARITLCADRDCVVPETTFDVTATSARVPHDLAHGVWYWNVRSVLRGGASVLVSPTWQFRTPIASQTIEWAFEERPDLNGDGFEDFAVIACSTTPGGPVAHLYPGNATELVGMPVSVGLVPSPSAGLLSFVQQLGDVNGDGFTDLLVSYPLPGGGLEIRLGEPGSTWRLPVLQTLDSATTGWVPHATFLAPNLAGDFDRDGYADTVLNASGSASGLRLARGSPSGWSSFESIGASPTGPSSLAAIDFDADGFDDLLATTPSLAWWRGGPTGLVGPTALGPAIGLPDTLHGVGDVDGDGYLDAIQAGWDASGTHWFSLVRGSATGPVRGALQSLAPLGASAEFEGPVGDVNNDGRIDLAVGSSLSFGTPTGFDVLLGGATGYSLLDTARVTVRCQPQRGGTRSIGDWNGDGRLDGMALCTGGTAEVLLGDTSGTPRALAIALPGARGCAVP